MDLENISGIGLGNNIELKRKVDAIKGALAELSANSTVDDQTLGKEARLNQEEQQEEEIDVENNVSHYGKTILRQKIFNDAKACNIKVRVKYRVGVTMTQMLETLYESNSIISVNKRLFWLARKMSQPLQSINSTLKFAAC